MAKKRFGTLFVLAPGFEDGPGTSFYCPYCMMFEGLLCRFPSLGTELEVQRIAFARPREALVRLLGDEHQACPVLVVPKEEKLPHGAPPPKEALGHYFWDEPEEIAKVLSLRFALPMPHY
ncbi:DUF3088 family protein [Candidatus Methylacidithermus pantelleriae]|uniref:DUF3088 domain-containing protein n=1 Tax=Candidatus Methylacidithermus pantelleriae TaxID=2744239 RepID=A0A8J2BH08_9BACT|nr:DUF3088 family protein [Candidatus Methylacidithermus pantelleriae]CAF0688966.1 conserved hypothetical protein [Candidatus Methylacidithermus pantelleriae]